MLDVLSEGFKKASSKLRGVATLDENNVSEAIETIRESLLEADVEYGVTKTFLKRVKEQALGQDVSLKAGQGQQKMKVSAGDHFIKICQEELENLMGPVDTGLNLPKNRIASVMMVGLQGTGKTTTTAKLARYLRERKERRPMLVAADTYRPAAMEQLKVLGDKLGCPVYINKGATPVEICSGALKAAAEQDCDVVLFDTAGRLTIDDTLMDELSAIKTATSPDNIILVTDAMMGQDAVSTAKGFHDRLDISGFIMTKLDGDARGGAALSIKEVTGRPIKFLGMGEDITKLDEFRPEGLASRILGMGDIVGLMDDFERVAEGDQEAEAMKMLSGRFNLKDFYQQISMIQKMGSLKDIIAKMPMQDMIPKDAVVDDKELVKIKAMIDSMTEKERLNPDVIDASRALRISKGSGTSLKDLKDVLTKFKSMRQMMGKLGKNMGGMMGKIPGMGGLSQLNQMRKMAGQMGGGGDMGAMMNGLMGGEGVAAPGKRIDRDKLKKARKAARKNKRKNRKK